MPSPCPFLISFWIEGTEPFGPIGFGVKAWSLEDAFTLIREYEYTIEAEKALIHRNVRPHEVDWRHVAHNSGPFVFRGIWYPCLNIGWGASGQHRRTQLA